MKRATEIVIGMVLCFLLGGCGTVKTDEEWNTLNERVATVTGQRLLWERSEKEQATLRDQIRILLSDGLTREEAQRIAILNNRTLQSRFEEIGISRADLVQAGLLTNPDLEAVFRFSSEGSTIIETNIYFSLSDLWQLPARGAAARSHMEGTIHKVQQNVLETAAETRRAYDAVLYFTKASDDMAHLTKKFNEISDHVALRKDFGFMSDEDVYQARIMVAEAEMDLSRYENELVTAQSHLTRILGLDPGMSTYAMASPLRTPDIVIPPEDVAIDYALKNRPDIHLARTRIRYAEEKLLMEKANIFEHVKIGVAYEREADREDSIGPAIEMQVPLFDQNRPMISESNYRIRQARKNLQALEGQVREEVISGLARLRFTQSVVQQFQAKILPLRMKALDYAVTWVNAMQLNKLYLLEAQKGLLKSRKAYTEALVDYNHAMVDLELHLGGQIPGGHGKHSRHETGH
jgi:cobalt-zinc-cadmium efflux system outer membrane protein